MRCKKDVQNAGYEVELLTPEILQKLAEQVSDLTQEDWEVINTLKDKLKMENDNGL